MSETGLPVQLAPVLALLDTFNRRNRNQHRRSAWWQQFGILRRSIRKLSTHPPSGVVPHTSSPSSSLETRMQELAENVIPHSYIAFTQLAADNQFAPLGLFLLALLAQIQSAISPLLRARASSQQHSDHTISAPPASSQTRTRTRTQLGEADLGVVVSRSKLDTTAPIASDTGRGLDPDTDRDTISRMFDTISPEGGKQARQKPKQPRSVGKTSAKKNRRPKDKTGTDLDHLFGSL